MSTLEKTFVVDEAGVRRLVVHRGAPALPAKAAANEPAAAKSNPSMSQPAPEPVDELVESKEQVQE